MCFDAVAYFWLVGGGGGGWVSKSRKLEVSVGSAEQKQAEENKDLGTELLTSWFCSRHGIK